MIQYIEESLNNRGIEKMILESLRKAQGHISGEELSKHLGVSRQALWKHIQSLKGLGYDIIAVPHLGYRLLRATDRILPYEIQQDLSTKIFGHKVYYFNSVSSTMDIAHQLGAKGVSEGAVVMSETQTKGRGRIGRQWFSPKYKGLYASLILRPKIPPRDAAVITLLTAVAAYEAINRVTGLQPQIKWPNDIILKNKKLAGILTELSAEQDVVHFIVVGIGINVNNDEDELLAQATSLKKQKGSSVNRAELFQEFLRSMESWYFSFCKDGSGPILENWRRYALTLNHRVRVCINRQYIEGEAVDVDSDGGLILRRDSGLLEKITAGEITHLY